MLAATFRETENLGTCNSVLQEYEAGDTKIMDMLENCSSHDRDAKETHNETNPIGRYEEGSSGDEGVSEEETDAENAVARQTIEKEAHDPVEKKSASNTALPLTDITVYQILSLMINMVFFVTLVHY